MKTVEELEAQLEGAKVMIDSLTRSLELAEAEISMVRQEFRAWKDAANLTTQQLIMTIEADVANLLAVIHGDGGHYAMAHEWGRAIRDAEAIVVALRKERDDLSEYLNDALRVLGEVSASAGIPTDAMFEDPTVITRRMR